MTQPPPGADQTPLPIALMKRLAEAASGYRDHPEFWLVCRFRPVEGKRPYDFQILSDRTSAEQQRNALNDGAGAPVYGAFGPFTATGDPKPDYRVVRVVLDIRPTTGEPFSIDVGQKLQDEGYWNGEGDLPCDALVWSLSALEKFILPYYTFVEGPEGAKRAREAFVAPGCFMTGHLPTTDYATPTVTVRGGAESVAFKIQDGGLKLLPL